MRRLTLYLLTIVLIAICIASSPNALSDSQIYPTQSASNQVHNYSSITNTQNYSNISNTQNSNQTATTASSVSITISAVGDCTLGMDPIMGYSGSFTDEYYKQNMDASYFLKNVKDIFSQDDLTIANLETTLTSATKKAKKEFRFKGLPEFTQILTEGNVEAVNIANNHTYDYLDVGYSDTLKNLKNAKIDYFGFENRLIKDIKGIKIGLLGYKGWDNMKQTKANIKKDIGYLKDNGAQIIIVSFHWGQEKKNYPYSAQIEYGHYAIDNGADLVIGHHPHVLQGIEQYKDKYIAYSLGNFCYGGSHNPSDQDTLIFQQTFKLVNNIIVNNNIKLIPCSLSTVDNRNNYQPMVLVGDEKERVIKKINTFSKSFNFCYIE